MEKDSRLKDVVIVTLISIVVLFVGLEILHNQTVTLKKFCENKTGIVQSPWWDVTEVNCDCWKDKDCSELPEECCVYGY